MYMFFFFQAEDGIRDYKVTGVQTCALPICQPARVEVRLKRKAIRAVAGEDGRITAIQRNAPLVHDRQRHQHAIVARHLHLLYDEPVRSIKWTQRLQVQSREARLRWVIRIKSTGPRPSGDLQKYT